MDLDGAGDKGLDPNKEAATSTPPPAAAEERPDRRRHIGKTTVEITGGSVVIFRYDNGDRGLRCDDDSLKDRVAEVCRKHNARWVPFPRFWLLSLEGCKAAVGELGGDPGKKPAPTPPLPTTGGQTTASLQSLSSSERERIPSTIPTVHGDITIQAIGTSDYAIRNPRHPEIIEVVKKACRSKGRWNPRYSNWIIEDANLFEVIETIRKEVS